MRRLRLSRPAEADIATILSWSQAQFGKVAAERYAALIAAALRDVALDPARVGAEERPELGAGLMSYHLFFSRKSAARGAVRMPRHLVLCRLEPDGAVAVGRVLHDAMELSRHLPGTDEGDRT